MWLDPFFSNNFSQDIVATVITFALSLVWLRAMDFLAQRGLIAQRLSRKIIHIGTGPLFVLCWNLFSAEPLARYLAALVPLAITGQFAAVGLGLMKDEAAVKAMTRHGDPKEILRGPLYYGVVFVLCTVLFWRNSPVGILALMLMCGGDGLADVVGRRWGAARLPFDSHLVLTPRTVARVCNKDVTHVRGWRMTLEAPPLRCGDRWSRPLPQRTVTTDLVRR